MGRRGLKMRLMKMVSAAFFATALFGGVSTLGALNLEESTFVAQETIRQATKSYIKPCRHSSPSEGIKMLHLGA